MRSNLPNPLTDTARRIRAAATSLQTTWKSRGSKDLIRNGGPGMFIRNTPRDPGEAATEITRLAILSTPRSGTTWLRLLLKTLYELDELHVRRHRDMNWDALPSQVVLQSHWRPESKILRRLEKADFRVVTIARHPLDTLISNLKYARHSPLKWAPSITNVSPVSQEFLDFATGDRAGKSLSCTRRWWQRESTCRIRYEDLLADPQTELKGLTSQIGLPLKGSIDKAIDATDMNKLRSQDPLHFWQGKPGLWKKFIPAHRARPIAEANHESFELLGYACDPDEDLTDEEAERNWLELI